MSLPKKPLPKPTKVKVGKYGQSKANLFIKQDLEEYARANPGPGLLEKISDGIKGLLKKLTKSA